MELRNGINGIKWNRLFQRNYFPARVKYGKQQVDSSLKVKVCTAPNVVTIKQMTLYFVQIVVQKVATMGQCRTLLVSLSLRMILKLSFITLTKTSTTRLSVCS